MCEAWLEGYVPTHRHGVFVSYEAFLNIIDSMLVLHIKWLQMARAVDWRTSVPSLNVLAMSHCWRQLNHYSHQDPSIVDHLMPHDRAFWDAYYPPDGRTAICCMERCLQSTDRVNIVVAGKQPSVVLTEDMDAARAHAALGLGRLEPDAAPSAGGGPTAPPLLILACVGEVMTAETLAAVELLHTEYQCPSHFFRVVNVVRLLALDPGVGVTDSVWDEHFPKKVPTIWSFHGHPHVIHTLLRERSHPAPTAVHGYRARGADPTTPFGLLSLNEADRFTLALAVLRALEPITPILTADQIRRSLRASGKTALEHIDETGLDLPELSAPPAWRWRLRKGQE